MKPNDYTKRQRIDAIKMALVMNIEQLEERGAILTSRKAQRCIIQDIRSTVEGVQRYNQSRNRRLRVQDDRRGGASRRQQCAIERSKKMDWYIWILVGGLVILVFGFYMLLARARAKADAELTPDVRRKKKALEDMADNLSP
jgi:hypothetical protein